MDSSDDKVRVPEKDPSERSRPIRLGGSMLGTPCHLCAFFNSHDDEYRVPLPFIKDGLETGEKAVHTVDSQRRDEHLRRLASGGIDVAAVRDSGQFELRSWTDTHSREGHFDQRRTLALFEAIVKDSKERGFPLIRFVTHMEWALENRPRVDDLLEYEARANDIWLRQDGPVNPVICTYDLSKFGGEIVVDVMRTHPMIIIGGILQENSFFVPPDEGNRRTRLVSAQTESRALDSRDLKYPKVSVSKLKELAAAKRTL
jgi:hypothetical protein